MKYLIIVLLYFSLTCAFEVHLRDGIKPKKFPPFKLTQDVLPKIDWEELRSVVERENKNLRAGSVEADVTNYTLAILANVANLIVHQGYDPMELSEEHLSLFPGSLDLTNGWLQDLSRITLSDSVMAKYSSTTKILELTLPLGFDALLVNFDYHVQIILIGVSGTMSAKITNLRLDLHMGFNFSKFHAFVDKVDVKNSGSIKLDITGFGLFDWIIDLVTGVVVTFLHGLILSIVDLIVYFPVQDLVDSINSIIDSVLHPNGTIFMMNQ